MNLEPRIVELSRDNFESAIETFLRATDKIHDSETPTHMSWVYKDAQRSALILTIEFKQQEVQNSVDQTVH